MLKTLSKKLNNQGNSFVMVVVSLAFLGILSGAIIGAVGYCYKLKAIDLNNKNNFYYVEQALDEIYVGIGSDSITYLQSAYNDTVEVMVYYDAASGAYVTMDEKSANLIMKQKFLQKMSEDATYKSQAALYTHLNSFITNPKSASNPTGVELVDPATVAVTNPRMYVEIVKQDNGGVVTYDKIIVHNLTLKRTTSDGYVQSITTDINIGQPEYDVAFNGVNARYNSLYSFAMLADMGIEINNATQKNEAVTIAGNIYAASDFYNKDYNSSAATQVSSYYAGLGDARLDACKGISDNSKYSGFYVQNSNVSIMANKVIVPGTIAVMNNAKLVLAGKSDITGSYSDLWADNIIMAPSSTYVAGSTIGNGTLKLYADAHIADDMEINSDDAEITLAGTYCGYNYAATSDAKMNLADYAAKSGAKSHYDSSAIIVNGQNTLLDMTTLSELTVAGRAYIEASKTTDVALDTDTNGNQVIKKSYYVDSDVEDYKTGESLSIKSNQLAYMPLGIDATTKLPIFSAKVPQLNTYCQTTVAEWLNTEEPTVIYTVSGKEYTFLNFKNEVASTAFFNWYANELPKQAGYDQSEIINIKKYANSDIDNIIVGSATQVKTSGAYTTGALNVAQNRFLTINGGPASLVDGEGTNIFNNVSMDNNKTYKQMRLALEEVVIPTVAGEQQDAAKTKATEIAAYDSKLVTPINYYMDLSKLSAYAANGKDFGGYKVWAAQGDVTVSTTNTDGIVKGLVICKGDVNFDPNVKRFEGLIVCGSKIYIDHQMSIVANEEIVKTILRIAEVRDDDKELCNIFKDYTATTPSSGGSSHPIGLIECGDILQYSNWKKNVE